MQLVAAVRESLAQELEVGQKLVAQLDALDHACEATISEIVPVADAATRSFEVKVTGPCPPGIYSGMFGRLQLPLSPERVLVVPATSVKRVGQLTMVEVQKGDQRARRSVEMGRRFGDRWEVLAGLREGEKVWLPPAN
jgi:multidrug efflux pump subunit AcrA (membrane-fusion protein)